MNGLLPDAAVSVALVEVTPPIGTIVLPSLLLSPYSEVPFRVAAVTPGIVLESIEAETALTYSGCSVTE